MDQHLPSSPALRANGLGVHGSSPMPWRHQVFLLRRAAASARHLRSVPATALEQAFPGIDELEIAIHYRYEPRGLPHGEAYVLSLLTAYVRPQRIFEIGTGAGLATLLMARQAPSAKIDTLDLGAGTASLGEQRGDEPLEAGAVGRAYRASPFRRAIVQHLGDSASFDFSPFYEQMDLVFVDGAHTYEYAKADSRTALSLIAPGGTIVWDDCHLYHPDVSAAILELRREGWPVERIDGTRLALLRDTRPRRLSSAPGKQAVSAPARSAGPGSEGEGRWVAIPDRSSAGRSSAGRRRSADVERAWREGG